MDIKMNLPTDVRYIMSKLLESGYEAHVVGGAVRDFLLGKNPGDYDITTSATPEEMKEVFAEVKTVDTGIKHGTVSVVLNHRAYEITTYRVDGEYLDSRHPESVSFTRNIKEDLSRRDFTVNAMAYSDEMGLIDLFSGESDLKRGLIRAVGSPDKRFEEDALRILRALRFASRLDFTIEENTSAAIFKKAPLLLKVAKERVFAEWRKLLAGPGAYRIINEYREVIKLLMPRLDSFSLPYESSFASVSPDLRFISLFADKGSDAWVNACDDLRSDNKIKLLGKILLENLENDLFDEYKIKLTLSKIGEENTRELLNLRQLLKRDSFGEKELFEKITERGDCYRLSDMKISGNELIDIGIIGKQTGKILSELLLKVMKGEIKNEREELLLWAVKLQKNA